MTFFALPFMRSAYLTSLLVGVALSLLGTFSATRSVSFTGLAASQWAALGTVLGVLWGWHLGASLLSVAMVLLCLLLMGPLAKIRQTPPDSWVAMLYAFAAGGSVLLLSKSAGGESDILTVFFGNILSLGRIELIEAVLLLVVVLAGLRLFFYRWLWLGFDPMGAEVAGLHVPRWNALFWVLFAAALTLAIHILGVLLTFSYLVMPATAALVATRRMKSFLLFCLGSTVLITTVGFELSYRWDFPTGPFVSVLLALTPVGSVFYRRIRPN